MKRDFKFTRLLLLLFLAFSLQKSFAQAVTITASSGTTTGSFTTLKLAFDAINAGTHKGVIVIKINASFTQTASASLNGSSGVTTTAPYYTSVTIYPTATGLSISGSLATPLIKLNGADNVTIDGRVNATGSTKSLTITNTSAAVTAGTSTIQFGADSSSNKVQYCILKGSSTDASSGIVLISAPTTTGNDNNIITNNDFTSAADASRPLNAIYAIGLASKNNDNNTISDNNFYNFLSKSTASYGININSYNSAFTITGNSFYQTASFVATASVDYTVILISAATGSGNGFTVSNNYIGGSAALCGGSTAWTKTAQNNAFTGISISTASGTVNNIQGNIIKNISWTNAGTSDFTGVLIAGATVANLGTITGNEIGASTGNGSITFTSNTTATDFFGISITTSGAVDCKNNTVGAITLSNTSTNATNFNGIFLSGSSGTSTISYNTIGSATTTNSINVSSASSTSANIQTVFGINSAKTSVVNITGNTIANLTNGTTNTTVTSTGLVNGIYVSSGTNTITNNTIHDLKNANANTNLLDLASVSGIVMTSSTNAVQTVSGNTIYNLSNSNASFAGGVIGIEYSGLTSVSSVFSNFIYGLTTTSNAAFLYGIKIDSGATKYNNNIISFGSGTSATIYGIFQTGIAGNNNSVYHNTIYIYGSLLSGVASKSYAFYSTGTLNTRIILNNIFVNSRSTVAGVSKHYALYFDATGGTLTCDYNNYYVSGTGGVLGYNATDVLTLPIITGKDISSISTNPTFTNAGSTTESDYSPTVLGIAPKVTGITTDYAGNTRYDNVTMGAIESNALPPNAPTNLVATTGVISASISFTAPSNQGGAPITDYQYTIDNGVSWTAIGNSIIPIFIDNLTECTNTIKIRAVNVVGTGTASEAIVVTPQRGKVATTWTSRTTPADNSWLAATFGNGLFVAVATTGTGNRVMTSPDGITWTSRTSAADNNWYSVTYGNGLFVAVAYSGAGNRVMTSPDGITWTIRTSAADNYWQSVTYGNGLFVAVASTGTGNRVMTSPNGITWTSRTTPADNAWTSITFANGLFVAIAVSGIGNRVMTSTDGITWTIRTSAEDSYWTSVTYGNGLFVAVATSGTNLVMTSPDGITWTIGSQTASTGSVAFGNGLFVAVNTSGGIYSSLNGITWSYKPGPTTNNTRCIIYGNGKFVSVAYSGTGNRAMTSSDSFAPGNPSINTITPTFNSASVAFTAPTNTGSTAITNYEYSIDNGTTWVTPSPAVTSSPLTISDLTIGTAYSVQLRAVNSVGASCTSAMVSTTTTIPVVANEPTNLVATAGVNSTMISFTAPSNQGGAPITDYQYTIDNGVSWTAIGNSISPIFIDNLTACTNYTIKIRAVNVVGTGTASEAIVVTPQRGKVATTWTSRTTPADNTWISATFGNGLFVAVATTGTGNRVMTSPDGITWTSRTSAADNDWTSVTYGNGLFVAVAKTGIGNRVMTSPDGITWTSRTTPANNIWNSVTYGNGLFVAVAISGTGNRVMTSPNGITWTSRTTPADNFWYSVIYGNGLFVAVALTGIGNRVMTSPDGITWTIRTSAADNSWYSVTYGNGQFVAVATSGTNKVMTSPDGITWTIGSQTASTGSVAFGNGLFVAVNTSGGTYSSLNGTSWSYQSGPTSNSSQSITFGNGKFVSVAYSGTGNRAMTSSDSFAPGNPSINTITPTFNSASVAFTAPTNTGSTAITNYEYSIDNGTTWVTPSPAVTSSPLTISDLTSGTAYTVQLRAVNSFGVGCTSATVNATTAALIPTWTGSEWINGVVSTSAPAIIKGAYTPSLDFEVGELTIQNNASVTIASGKNLKVNGKLTVEVGSNLTLQSNANLIQTTEEQNSGSITIRRQTPSLKLLDYVMWSSPVANQQLQSFASATLSNRFYTYNPVTNLYNAIASPSTTLFAAGEGYLIRMPNNHLTVPTIWTGSFTGIPNNGTVSLPVTSGTYNAIGNPYPSTFNADAFIDTNGITEALYFWRKTNNAANPSYASYTKAGGIATANASDPLGLVPNGVIQVGQGFIVKSTSSAISFTNAMRIANNGNQFLRTKNADKSRIWLNLTNASGFFSQAMVAYMDGATAGIDPAIDGLYFNDCKTALTSIINNEEYSIQGRSLPFDTADMVPLGFKTDAAGTFTLAIDHSDGLFAAGQKVFLQDNVTNTVHDLSTDTYKFTTDAGVFNSRFALIYQNTLGVDDADALSNQVLLYKQNDKIKIDAGSIVMAAIKVYDLNGRLLFERKNINANQFAFSIATATDVLLIKMTSNDGKVISKKIIN